ncbi:MAG: discoidin domain-containing protein [Phycisphaerae bacterium]|nr:discoidin domain-containing protein [Phycisphaerae bacterium]
MIKRWRGLVCLGLVLGLVQADVGRAMDPNLVGWWTFDETSGTVAADSSVRGNHGTVQGTPQWTSGQVDGDLTLDGTTTYVELPKETGTVIKSLTECTFALWVNWAGALEAGDSQMIFEFGSDGSKYMYLQPGTNVLGPLRYVIRSPLGGREEQVAAVNPLGSGWHHVVVTIDSAGTMALYVDGALEGSTTMVNNRISYVGATFYHYVGRGADEPPFFKGRLDDFTIFNRVLSQAELVKLQLGGALGLDFASKPSPADQKTDVLRDVTLSWTAGMSAATHDVYFGTDPEAVKGAGPGSPLQVSLGQAGTTWDVGRLEFGRTYSWRVDEVDASPSHAVFAGDVWSFTVEPYAYPIPPEGIAATASSFVAGRGPERTLDGSGLTGDYHSTVQTDMWQTAQGTALPAWIQYAFDKPYRLSEMQVWNYNGVGILAIYGAKEVVVEHSMDGSNWTALSGVTTFPKASGTADHPSDITVDFGGVAAQFVRIAIQGNYSNGASKQCGLSEVRLMAVPMSARNPNPEPDANHVDPSVVLSWRPGREAAHHRVYLDTQEESVRQGTAPVTTTDESRLAGLQLGLRLGRTYFWRVDEVNDAAVPSVWPGGTWAFTTLGHIVVDDFESYGNTSPDRPFQTWVDGIGFTEPAPGNPGNNTGAAVGHDIWNAGSAHYNGSIMEPNLVHSGRQSMPLYYDNSGAGGHLNTSQADRTLAEAQDWTRFGITRVVVHFYGSPGNTGRLYVQINGTKISYPGSATDLATEAWTRWEIDLTSRAATAKSVSTLSIGVDGSGASGLLYIDDLWLE